MVTLSLVLSMVLILSLTEAALSPFSSDTTETGRNTIDP